MNTFWQRLQARDRPETLVATNPKAERAHSAIATKIRTLRAARGGNAGSTTTNAHTTESQGRQR